MLLSAIYGQPSKLVDSNAVVVMRGRKWSDVIKTLEELDSSTREYIVSLKRVPVKFPGVTLGVWNLTATEV